VGGTTRVAIVLQSPEWAAVKREWRSESIGWFDVADVLVGAGLILYRDAPVVPRALAYLPEGPDIDWLDERGFGIDAWLKPLIAHAKKQRAFTVKIGVPVEIRRWDGDLIKDSVGAAARLSDVAPSATDSRAVALKDQLGKLGWTQQRVDEGFGDVQPRFVYMVDVAGKSDEELLSSFNQLWRRNLKKAEKSGVVVREGGRDDLEAFHNVYWETAKRDGFTPRSLPYFQRFWDALQPVDGRIKLFLAEIDGEVAAATVWVRVGTHAWYSYGASTTKHRDARPSNAIQWAMLRATRDEGAKVYDLRGISDTLDESHPLFGLIRFKLGIGGYAVEYVGEHDFAINRVLAKLFAFVLSRR